MRRLAILVIAFCVIGLGLSGCADPYSERSVASPGSAAPSSASEPVEARPTAAPASAGATTKPIGGTYPGTDRFVKSPAPGSVRMATDAEGSVTLNFVDADIREVVKAVLGDIMGRNYVIDPGVQGTVTMQTARPLSPNRIIPALEHILALNGAALVQSGDYLEVVPADRALHSDSDIGIASRVSRSTVGSGLVVVPLQHIAAAEAEKVLEPFAPPGALVRVDRTRNLLVIAGNQSTRSRMLELIDMFDVDWLSGMSFGLFPVHTTNAVTIVDELELVFGEGEEGPLGDLVRFVPIERLNAVLVISPRNDYLRKAARWISRLDVGEEEAQRIFVYYVEHSRATDLAGVLNQVFGDDGARERVPLAPGARPVELAAAPEAAAAGVTPAAPIAVPQVRGTPGEGIAGVHGAIRIIADETKNALVIMATPRDYRLVEAALQRLDVVPLQVLIETTIFEVTLDDQLRYGLEWFFGGGDNSFRLTTNPLTGAVAAGFPGFSYLLNMNGGDITVVLNALEEVTDVNVISSPTLAVLDNQTASLQVGEQVPILTQQQQQTTIGAPVVNSIEYRDTGVTLNVTPNVNASGFVTLEVEQDVSNVIRTTTSGIDSPTIEQRQIKSSVTVRDGETIALGGLIRERSVKGTRGIPVLQHIPVLGLLFSTKSDETRKTELMIVITPRVIRNVDEARKVTDELRSRLTGVAPLRKRFR